MVTRSIGGAERDYLLLEYRGGDRLYLPSEQIDAITPYTGGESPTLNRMGGAEWSRQKARVRAAVREVAKELVELYRRRHTTPGHAFAPDTPWQAELEQAFPYPETPDQLKAIDDVKADMEQPVPMDRLVCGDVGFGKTEVAVRAVFKAVQDGHQAAILVPTTLLAQQHFQTFSDRYAPYPIRVEVLSRFLTTAEARKVVDGLADGSVDVVIGTHRLLTPDVRFKKLGLLVVDEEQRFGVSHKEAIKQLTIGVDVLTLTASPIPRTLEMSLTGIRDLSLITTPPSERQPILTYVGEHDERAVAEAIRRELLREGQIFYVHNRVHDIERVAAELRDARPRCPRRRRPRPDGRRDPRAGRARLLGRGCTTCSSARRSSSRASTCRRSTPSSWTGPTVSASASSTSSAAGSGGRAGVRTPTCCSRRTGCSPSRPTSGCGRSASTPSSVRGSRSPCATSRSEAPATCSGGTSRDTSRRSATTFTCGSWPRPSRS